METERQVRLQEVLEMREAKFKGAEPEPWHKRAQDRFQAHCVGGSDGT